MSDLPKVDGGIPPVVLDMLTLGRAVRLGELYDQRSGKFLGAHLYPQDKIQEVVTDIRHTELSVSLSTTHKQKASLLDVNAQLSLEVLGGLCKITGSASYLNDEKSNSQEFAYALALKMRLNEKRMLFTENELGRNVLPFAEKDYIKLATHFVSSIIYGGNFIVNLVARQSMMSKEEKIEGKLQIQFDKLKGAISLEGAAEAKVKGEFSDMNDKFDLVIHGDVALGKVPVNPKDVLDTFPEAASLISENGGVPVSVTLQPIPADLYKGGLIYQLDDDIVDIVLMEFSKLDDLSSRFLVLQDGAKRLRDFVPELARTTDAVAAAYAKDYNELLHKLGKFLQQHKLGNKPDHSDVINVSTDLYKKHLEPSQMDSKISTQYPSSLTGLEKELLRFHSFITDIRRVRRALRFSDESTDIVDRLFYLSSLEDVCSAIRVQTKTPLFIMVPMSGDDSNYTLTILKYIAIVRKYAEYFQDAMNPGRMLYAENLQALARALPHGQTFSGLTRPALFIGEVDDEGDLAWASPPPPRVPPPVPLTSPPQSTPAPPTNPPQSTPDPPQASSLQSTPDSPPGDQKPISPSGGTPGPPAHLQLAFRDRYGIGTRRGRLEVGGWRGRFRGGRPGRFDVDGRPGRVDLGTLPWDEMDDLSWDQDRGL